MGLVQAVGLRPSHHPAEQVLELVQELVVA
jgi:hypothetical protein